jgi:MOSC domain-containing protein YiiM
MSEANIMPGDRVRIGEAELEMTPKPHTGCVMFIARYGKDALKVFMSPEGRRQRLRGIYFRVVKDGVMKTGDSIVKL